MIRVFTWLARRVWNVAGAVPVPTPEQRAVRDRQQRIEDELRIARLRQERRLREGPPR